MQWNKPSGYFINFINVKVCKTYNGAHKIMKHFRVLVWFDSPQVKWYMKSSTKNIVYELPHELPNDLRLKSQEWVEVEPSTQSPFHKKTLVPVIKNYTKTDIKIYRLV